MKIRIKGNSIRYRLSKSEVDHFGQTGELQESTSFGNNHFVYALKKREGSEGLSAAFSGNTITMYMSDADARTWTGTERVGYENNMDIGNGETLFLLLEKDFKCLDNTHEDQSDMYDNPLAEFHK